MLANPHYDKAIQGLILLLAVSLSACGWHLRGLDSGTRPEALALVVENRFEPLVLTTQEVMQQNGIRIDSTTALQLHLGRETLMRRTVAVTAIGSASQYELTLSVPFKYVGPNITQRTASTLQARRVFDFDPASTVAKNEEENTLLNEMRRELAIRLLERVPSSHGQN